MSARGITAAGPSRNSSNHRQSSRAANSPYHRSSSRSHPGQPSTSSLRQNASPTVAPLSQGQRHAHNDQTGASGSGEGDEKNASDEDVYCTGHTCQGKNKLGKINPERQAKKKGVSYREGGSSSKQEASASVKAEPDDSADEDVFDQSHVGSKGKLPAGTLFDGAPLMSAVAIDQARATVQKSFLKRGRIPAFRILKQSPQVWDPEDQCTNCTDKMITANTPRQHDYSNIPCIVSAKAKSGKCFRCCVLGLECYAGVVFKDKTLLKYPDGCIARYNHIEAGADGESAGLPDPMVEDDVGSESAESDDPQAGIKIENMPFRPPSPIPRARNSEVVQLDNDIEQNLRTLTREKAELVERLAEKEMQLTQADQIWGARDTAWSRLATLLHQQHSQASNHNHPPLQLRSTLIQEMDNLRKLTELPKVQSSLPEGCASFLNAAVKEVEGLIKQVDEAPDAGVAAQAEKPDLQALLADLPPKPERGMAVEE